MAAFSADTDLQSRIDWHILQHGAISLYHSETVLAEDAAWLRAHGYVIHEFDSSRWGTAADLHDDIARVLQFPEWYGRNLDALNDCLSDVDVPDEGGVALVFRAFDGFAQRLRETAQHLLDIVEDTSHSRLLFGRRLVALVQTDNPELEFERVGGRPVTWNRREWLRARRGLPPRPPISSE